MILYIANEKLRINIDIGNLNYDALNNVIYCYITALTLFFDVLHKQ